MKIKILFIGGKELTISNVNYVEYGRLYWYIHAFDISGYLVPYKIKIKNIDTFAIYETPTSKEHINVFFDRESIREISYE